MTQIDSKLCTVTKKVGNKNTGKNGNTKNIQFLVENITYW